MYLHTTRYVFLAVESYPRANGYLHSTFTRLLHTTTFHPTLTMAEEDEIAALVIDNGSGMCKGGWLAVKLLLSR